jgi:hypothetical protein
VRVVRGSLSMIQKAIHEITRTNTAKARKDLTESL